MSVRTLKKQYYQHSLEWHPDRWAGASEYLQGRAQEMFTLISEAHTFIAKHLKDMRDKPCTEFNPFCDKPDQFKDKDSSYYLGHTKPVTMQCSPGGGPCSVREDGQAGPIVLAENNAKKQVYHHPADKFDDEEAMYKYYATHKH